MPGPGRAPAPAPRCRRPAATAGPRSTPPCEPQAGPRITAWRAGIHDAPAIPAVRGCGQPDAGRRLAVVPVDGQRRDGAPSPVDADDPLRPEDGRLVSPPGQEGDWAGYRESPKGRLPVPARRSNGTAAGRAGSHGVVTEDSPPQSCPGRCPRTMTGTSRRSRTVANRAVIDAELRGSRSGALGMRAMSTGIEATAPPRNVTDSACLEATRAVPADRMVIPWSSRHQGRADYPGPCRPCCFRMP